MLLTVVPAARVCQIQPWGMNSVAQANLDGRAAIVTGSNSGIATALPVDGAWIAR